MTVTGLNTTIPTSLGCCCYGEDANQRRESKHFALEFVNKTQSKIIQNPKKGIDIKLKIVLSVLPTL